MIKIISRVFNKIQPVFIISIILFIIPFFWLNPGEMDLGGDDNRLFFYDPITYISNSSLFDLLLVGRGIVDPRYYDIPYVGLLAVLKYILISPTLLISLINGLKLSGAFIGIYLISFEILESLGLEKRISQEKLCAVLSGLFYVVSFGSIDMVYFWDRALTSHNQLFLNPLIFYLLLKFMTTSLYKYLWTALLIVFIFAPNFSLSSAPPFFAFYPLALLFLLIFVKYIVKKSIPWKGILIGVILFLGIHAFHLLGQILSLLDSGNYISSRIFNKDSIEHNGVQYFSALKSLGKPVLNLLMPSYVKSLQWTSFIVPMTILSGFFINRNKKKTYLLLSLFFLITIFLTSANITSIGYELYQRLFYVPGFSMFRNFHTQWKFILIFFYSLLFGAGAYSLVLKLKPLHTRLFYIVVSILLVFTGMPLFFGEYINKSIIRGSNEVATSFEMDPQYEETLNYIRHLPDDGKILVVPLTDYYVQVVTGKNGGAYEGPSMFRYLTNKYSFVGYQDFGYLDQDPAPYAEAIMKYSRDKNYDRLLSIITTLNIRYILHNTDPNAYEESFSPGPFGYMQTSLPKTQDEYKEFITHFPFEIIYTIGPYVIYEISEESYNSTIFIPDDIYFSSQLLFDKDKAHAIFIDENVCNFAKLRSICTGKYIKPDIDISLRMMNPTLYAIDVHENEPVEGYLLVMQHTFHSGWKMVVDDKYVAENTHIPVNGYANGWYLTRDELPDNRNYTLYIKLDPQKYFWYGIFITVITLALVIFLLIFSIAKSHDKK